MTLVLNVDAEFINQFNQILTQNSTYSKFGAVQTT